MLDRAKFNFTDCQCTGIFLHCLQPLFSLERNTFKPMPLTSSQGHLMSLPTDLEQHGELGFVSRGGSPHTRKFPVHVHSVHVVLSATPCMCAQSQTCKFWSVVHRKNVYIVVAAVIFSSLLSAKVLLLLCSRSAKSSTSLFHGWKICDCAWENQV